MSSDQRRQFEDLGGAPLEVRLVSDTTLCRTCEWFWRPPPYGPYPAFDTGETYPEEYLDKGKMHHFLDGDHARSLDGRCRSQQLVDPQILHGCRKAPLMTIGINPNLTGFWPGTQGARWSYPYFASLERYAYYYRHRTVHQESFPLDFIRENLRQEGALRARKAGRIAGTDRSDTERQMTLRLAYADGETEELDQRWDDGHHFVLLFDRSFSDDVQFQAGDVIGGFLDLPEDAAVELQQNVVGYYQRAIPVLERVSSYLRSRRQLPDLQLSEDCSQLDMVACPSPGWGDRYQIDKEEVVRNCVLRNAWVVKQLVQSNPKLIVFSGRSAFHMFHQIFKPLVTPGLYDEIDVYGLMKYTSRDPHYLHIEKRVGSFDYRLRARLLISPHFSYDDNFLPHARMSQEEWEGFRMEHPDAAEELMGEEAVTQPNRDGYRGIRLDRVQGFGERHPRALIRLTRKFYDASALIGDGIAQELVFGNVAFDSESGHLERSTGPCRFCVNEHWQFPEGCAYGKHEEPALPDGALDAVVESLLEDLQEPS